MENNYDKMKRSYYFNLVARKIQNAFVSSPELGFVALIVVGIIVLFIIAKLFIHLP